MFSRVFYLEDTPNHSKTPKENGLNRDLFQNIFEVLVSTLLAKIKKKYKKGRGDFISVDEFCDFTSLKKESVREFLST
jgi:hypothetical protein